MEKRDRIADPWGDRTPYAPGDIWRARVDSYLADGVEPATVHWVPSASVLHSNGDALDIAVREDPHRRGPGPGHGPVNRGRLGPKDLFGWQAGSPGR